MPPALKALVAQLAGWAVAIALARHGALHGVWPLAAVQAITAAGIAIALRSARWWLPIHLAFSPLLIVAGRLDVAPGWYLGAFALLAVTYWTSFRTQVPLYPTNGRTVATIADLLPARRPLRVLDAGSGTGALLCPLARLRPDCRFDGIEAAPGPWLLSRLRGRGQANLHLARGDFLARAWSEYDVVYAFLSPVPMAEVWAKAQRELARGSLLVSNSFAVPDRAPERVVEVGDERGTVLYLYRVGSGAARAE